MNIEEADAIGEDSRLILQALYELSLEACGGDAVRLDSLAKANEMPNVLAQDLHRRYLKLKQEKVGGVKYN